jgi:hypothetical protein
LAELTFVNKSWGLATGTDIDFQYQLTFCM